MRGFSLLELLIAMTIGCAVIGAALSVYATEDLSTAAQSYADMRLRAQELLDTQLRMADEDPMLVYATTSDDGTYLSTVSAERSADASMHIRATIVPKSAPSLGISYDARASAVLDPDAPDTCDPTLAGDWNHPRILNAASPVYLDAGNAATGMVLSHGIAYLTANGASSSKPDLYAIDVRDPAHPSRLGALDTGPGLAGLALASTTLYLANTSKTGQLQIADIRDPTHMSLLSNTKITEHNDGVGNAIYYYRKKAYLGLTASGNDNEFLIYDVRDPRHPAYLGGYTLGPHSVNAVIVRNSNAYLATPDNEQLVALDVGNPAAPTKSGARMLPDATAYGESFAMVGHTLYFGRAEGLARDTKQLYRYDLSHPSVLASIGAPIAASSSVNGIVVRGDRLFLATNADVQEWVLESTPRKIASLPLPGKAAGMVCDGALLYVAVNGPSAGTDVLKIIGPGV